MNAEDDTFQEMQIMGITVCSSCPAAARMAVLSPGVARGAWRALQAGSEGKCLCAHCVSRNGKWHPHTFVSGLCVHGNCCAMRLPVKHCSCLKW